MLFLFSVAHATHVLYLNKDGGHFQAGQDDSARNTSTVLRSQRVPKIDVAPFRPEKKLWADTVACVRQGLADFDIDVVTARPSSGDYAMVVVGAAQEDFKTDARGGLGPGATKPLYNGIAFTFTGASALSSCSNIVHEFGHVMGLDHVYLFDDIMSTGVQFENQSSVCGKQAPRNCRNGDGTQNSYRRMVDALGLKPGVTEKTKNVVPVSFHNKHPGDCSSGPDLDVTFPGASWLPEYSFGEPIEITVRATDKDGVQDVHLVLAVAPEGADGSSNASLRKVAFREDLSFACSRGTHGTLSCEQTGDAFVFKGKLSKGLFRVRVVAQDKLGHRNTYERYARVK